MSAEVSTPLMEGRGLQCERDGRLLFSNLDFSLGGGEILRIKGPNGSGKTTLLRSLSGLSQRCRGSIRWRGSELEGCRYEFMRDSLYVGHDPAIKLRLSAVENLRWHCALWGRKRPLDAHEALARLGLAASMDVPTQQLSAGQRRRVSLARLLLSPASLWILDEPFTAIDVDGVAEIERLIAAHADAGGAVLLTTHHSLGISRPMRALDLGDAEGNG